MFQLSVLSQLCEIFRLLCDSESNSVNGVNNFQGIRKTPVADVVIKAFIQILCSPTATRFVAGLKQHVTLACPLVRILMLNEVW